ncbi:hypothetical protein DEO72_LG2g2680 [Vigna unguiculata]|uniref:Uncharacterized protein n=1 Tax=Vigna unguiculata TaxID=3917 RepID=A0A4D6L1J5_VIGUN|nr:hypothetical protein DEO72_LG2g2680 [Vigna unguiculata]
MEGCHVIIFHHPIFSQTLAATMPTATSMPCTLPKTITELQPRELHAPLLHPLSEMRASLHHTTIDMHCIQPFSHAAAHHLDAAITIESSSSCYHHNH